MDSDPSLSIPSLPVFFLLYVTIYLLGYFIIFRNWKGDSRTEASSCLISLAHGTPAVLSATFCLLHHHHHHPIAPLSFASPNTALQNMILEYSIAYFFTDLLHYTFFIPTDTLFIAHHVATIYVFVTCRYMVHHGAYPILVLLVLAEVTSACQNAWTLAGFRRADSPAAARVHRFLSPLFYSFYSVARGILGPTFVYKMWVFYSSGEADDAIPKWVWVSWMAVIVSAIVVSWLWVLNLWIDFYRESSKRQRMKLN